MTAHDPFFSGPWSDLLCLIPFAALIAGLYLSGRLAPNTSPPPKRKPFPLDGGRVGMGA
jgi:hypothetical protein